MDAKRKSLAASALHHLTVLGGSGAMTLACFLVLPLIQAIDEGKRATTALANFDPGALPQPEEAVIEEEIEEEELEEEEPPELEEEIEPLSLEQLELALEPSAGEGGWGVGDFTLDLSRMQAAAGGMDEIFQMGELDQKPRQLPPFTQPRRDAKVKKASPGKVIVVFIVNEKGRVERPKIKYTDDPILNKATLDAVKQWRFEPARRNGKPVSTPVKRTIAFPKP